MRVVADYDVDRAQVYRRRRQSRALLIARELVFVTDCPCSPGRVRLKGVSRVSFLCYVFCIHVLCVIVIKINTKFKQKKKKKKRKKKEKKKKEKDTVGSEM